MSTTYRLPTSYLKEELWKIANYLMTPGKGIVALDQDDIENYFGKEDLNIENTEENRRKFRDLVLMTDQLGDHVSGIILPLKAYGDIMPGGESVVQYLKKKGIVSGVRLETGFLPLIGSDGECTTSGLSELNELCELQKTLECHFAKWRCVYRVGEHVPSALAITSNAESLAKFASICQNHRLVPIIEPEILPEGKHSLLRAQKIAETVLAAVFKSLNSHHVYLEGLILKVNFVTAGMEQILKHTPQEIALATIKALNRTVPPAVMGIVFLAGSAWEEVATEYLDAINQPIARSPWPLSFSYGRGMLASVIKAWAGESNNEASAQELLLQNAKKNSLAANGKYLTQKLKMLRKQKKAEDKAKALKSKKIRSHRFYDDTVD